MLAIERSIAKTYAEGMGYDVVRVMRWLRKLPEKDRRKALGHMRNIEVEYQKAQKATKVLGPNGLPAGEAALILPNRLADE